MVDQIVFSPKTRNALLEVDGLFKRLVQKSQLFGYFGAEKTPLKWSFVSREMGLSDVQPINPINPTNPSIEIDIDRICGMVEDVEGVDRAFRPSGPEIRSEWISIAMKYILGKPLPRLKLYQWGEAYFAFNQPVAICVSVLKAYGERRLPAEVHIPREARVEPPTIAYLEFWESQYQKYQKKTYR